MDWARGRQGKNEAGRQHLKIRHFIFPLYFQVTSQPGTLPIWLFLTYGRVLGFRVSPKP
jgi:hypothetical protein